MKLTLDGDKLIVTRETGDYLYYESSWGSAESHLLYHVKQNLNAMGFELIKKRMCMDGHLVVEDQHYLRATHHMLETPHIYVWNARYAVESVIQEFNEHGETFFSIEYDVYGIQEDAKERTQRLFDLEHSDDHRSQVR